MVWLQITNEVNISFCPNTSDGAYANAVEALARGVPAAKREARRRGYDQLTTGFNYAWRFGDSDADFWRAVGEAGGERLRRATDWVGVDAYPGTFIPPAVTEPGDSTCSRRLPRYASATCRSPASVVGRRSTSRSSATRPAPAEARRRRPPRSGGSYGRCTDYRGTYGITTANWFGLRDNNSAGPNFQSYFGLLRDDYSPKPAFDAYRRLIRRLGG